MDTHLKGIGVENFRVFKNAQYFDFAPITVLTGTNSSGKSSLINLLKLLSESYKDISWEDSQRGSFTLSNFLATGISKNWCIKKFGNAENITNKFNKERSRFSFSHITDMPGYENSISIKIYYEFDLKETGPSEISLRSIKMEIANIQNNKITESFAKALLSGKENINDLINKEIFSIDFGLKKMSNSKIGLNILYSLYSNRILYAITVKKEIEKLQELLNKEDTEDVRTVISKFMRTHDLIFKIVPTKVNQQSVLLIKANDSLYRGSFKPGVFLQKISDLTQEFDIESLKKDEKQGRRLSLIDSWCSYDTTKIKKIDLTLKGFFGSDATSGNHQMFYKELFKLLSEVVWYSDKYDSFQEFDGIDDSYIYFGSSNSNFPIKDSYGFSLKDFIKRAFHKNFEEIYNADWWLDSENELFYNLESVNKDFIKDALIPVLQIIFENINFEYALGIYQTAEEIFSQSYEHDKSLNSGINDTDFDRFFKLSEYERDFYNTFIFSFIRKIFEPLKGFKILDSIANQRTYDSRVVSVLNNDETSLRIAKNTLNEEKLKKIKRFWKKHLTAFEIADDIKIEIDTESMFYKIFLLVNNEWVNLKDMGFGVSQIIPILISLSQEIDSMAWLYDQDESKYLPILMLIEEPESNLHPALQSKLADFFIEASEEFNIQFIIETHSEYLIRKLQYLTAKKEIKTSDTQLYYFHHPNRIPEGEKQIYSINIREDGSLTKNFGTGFFDEAGKQEIQLYTIIKDYLSNGSSSN